MAFSVDFDFIHTLEGARLLDGYVPDAEGSDSGVTIASGVDLGQRRVRDLENLGLGRTLIDKLTPYLGLRKQAALRKLDELPLSITEAEADELDLAIKNAHISGLVARFDADSDVPFSDLEAAKQTVIASVSFQYGVGLAARTPNFWRQITSGDWHGALANLENFGDRYPTRRRKEAALLKPSIEV